MFDIGFWELALIGVLALLVLGPKRLPEAARTAGLWVGKLRAFVSNVKQDINREIESGEIEELRRLKDELSKARNLIEESSNTIYRQADSLAGNVNQAAKAIGSPASTNKKKSPAKKKTAARKKTARKKLANKKAAKKKTANKKSTRRKAR